MTPVNPDKKAETLHPYYDLGPVVSANCWFNIIVGERGVGKTFGFILRGIKRAIKFGEEFIYLRRYREDMKSAKSNFFTQMTRFFPDYEFRVHGMKGYYKKRDDENAEWHTVVHFCILSNWQSIKSSDFYEVRQVIFDEFIIEKSGLVQYLPNEVAAFQGFYETIDRRRSRVRVYFLGNSASSANPYFIEWNIRPNEMEELTVDADNFLLVHIANSASYRDSIADTPFGRFTAGTAYDRYAAKNQFFDDHNALIGSKPSHATPQWNLETRFGSFSAWVDPDTGTYYMQEKLIGWNHPMLTMLPELMDENRVLVDPRSRIMARVRTAYRRGGSIYYDTVRTRNAMLEVFKR